MSVNNPTCPSGCNSIAPSVSFSACDPKFYFGEIRKIYVASGDAASFTDVEDLAEWTARLAESGGTIESIRELTVMGDLPLADFQEIEMSNKRKAYPPQKFTVNIDIDDISDTNYEFMRATGCNTQLLFWFATDDHIYGGNDGILASFKIGGIIERGNQSVQKLSGTITWESKFAPERNDSPFAA